MLRPHRRARAMGAAAALAAFLEGAAPANPFRRDLKTHGYWEWGFEQAAHSFGCPSRPAAPGRPA